MFLGDANSFVTSDFIINSGRLNFINNSIEYHNMNSFVVNGDFTLDLDADLANETMDRLPENTSVINGFINVDRINLLSDSIRSVTSIPFAYDNFKDYIKYVGADELSAETQVITAYAPIYKYSIFYNSETGNFVFTRPISNGELAPPVSSPDGDETNGTITQPPSNTPENTIPPSSDDSDKNVNPPSNDLNNNDQNNDDNNSNDSSAEIEENTPNIDNKPSSSGSNGSSSIHYSYFNPSVLTSSVAATAGGLGTMNYVMNYSFKNSSDYMNFTYKERQVMKNRNKYALVNTNMGPFSPIYEKEDNGSLWMKPYTTFENIPLKNGPKVSNIMYGTLAGFDTKNQSIKLGWDRTITGYVGYNGASQKYSGIDSTLNGGLLGGTITLYKGNFFNATTVNIANSIVNSQTMYGNEEFNMCLSGIGNKMGYNFEFKDGKIIIQPSMMMSYTFVNVEDYTNSVGVKIKNNPIHSVQLVPSTKVIANTKNGWQPYAAVSMVLNLNGKSEVMANDVSLPQMSIKPYVQYGVGVQKKVNDNFTAYGQTMIQNGGRNGVSLTFGFRWAIGKDKAKTKTQKI